MDMHVYTQMGLRYIAHEQSTYAAHEQRTPDDIALKVRAPPSATRANR